MPVNLDSCISGLFVPGNIGASAGLPPVVPTIPSLVGPAPVVLEPASASDTLDAFFGELLHEVASALDSYTSVIDVTVTETAAANSTQDATSVSAEVAAFLARTSGLDATHVNAYTALIDGLVADGIWAKLDMLHIYATQNAATADLNLIGNIYNATPTSSPTFTADQGYTGASTGTKYLRTNFTPSTASSPKFTQNSAHVSIWSLTNATTASALIMGSNSTGTNVVGMHARFTGNLSYFYVNDGSTTNVSNSSSIGHFLANRSTSSATQGYKNGASVVTNNSSTSSAVSSREIFVAGQNQNGTAFGSPYQVTMASIGSSLTPTEVINFYNRLRTYMTAVGVP